MESSRIFVKGLPPTFTEAEFRKYFSQQERPITDAKIFPGRRIGFIGYKTADDAQKAVKYFNRTFIRMSRIYVELARSVQDAQSVNPLRSAPTSIKQNSFGSSPTSDNVLSKRKRDVYEQEQAQDPKLKEFLAVMQPKSKRKAWESEVDDDTANSMKTDEQATIPDEEASDDEYEVISKKVRQDSAGPESGTSEGQNNEPETSQNRQPDEPSIDHLEKSADQQGVSDADWARSRTSRLLGLLDEEEATGQMASASRPDGTPLAEVTEDDDISREQTLARTKEVKTDLTNTVQSLDVIDSHDPAGEPPNPDINEIRSTMRLFVRNLPFDVKEEELEMEFSPFGHLEETHVPRDRQTGSGKGFALLQYSDPDSAQKAMTEKDGRTFQGRLLHVLPAKAKRDNKLDDFELSKLPLKKQQQIKKRREAAATTFNWNALYMNADAVVSSVADRLGISKSEVLDPTSSDAAVKQAHAETHVIQETKAYFKQHGVDLDAFKRSQRGDTAILIKNIPYDYSKDELRRLFEEHGALRRFLLPPSGVIAVIEFANAAQCTAAYSALAYRRIKSSMLFLEKAPKDLFNAALAPPTAAVEHTSSAHAISKTSASDLRDGDLSVPESVGIATLFVRNLNFITTTEELTNTFKPLAGFLSARVKTKTDPKKPGQVLSMGFGFLEFRSSASAQAALHTMDGHVLAGHKLQIRASHKGTDAAEERRKADAAKRSAGNRTKVVIKNLPFEATKKDVRALFGAYGQLRSVRVPKKMDRGARGFAFADFTTPKEAESAMDALKDTHLLGRRLVLDFAEADVEDAEVEIEKMQQKVGAQVNKMALQKLTSGGRKKFTTGNDETEDV